MENEQIKNTTSNKGIKILIGGLFLVFGLATLYFYVGIVFLIISIIAFTYGSGIEIDYGNNKIRSYTKYLWIVKGKWIGLDNFKKLMIRRIRKGVRQYGGRTSASTSRLYTYYDVYLMSDNYYKGIMMFSSKDKDSSIRFAENWSKKLNLPIFK